MKRKYALSSIMITALMIVTSFSVIASLNSPMEPTQKASTASYTPHAPILIDGDADLAAQAASEGWPGSGTPSDPYVISGLNISAPSSSGIDIKNTTSDLIIANCYVHDVLSQGTYGISVSYCSNAVLKDNICSSNHICIALGVSDNCTISNNDCSNSDMGIALFELGDCNISSNNCSKSGSPIYSIISGNCTVSNNDCSNASSDYGIYLEAGYNCTIDNNDCSNASVFGIFDYLSSKSTIRNNDCSNAGAGILIAFSGNCTVDNNDCSYSYICGIGLQSKGKWGNCTVSDNDCSKGLNGIYIQTAIDCMIIGNDCSDSNNGTYLYHSTNCTVSGNDYSNCHYAGILLDVSGNCTIVGNTCSNAFYNILLGGANNCTVSGNVCSNATCFSIALEGSNDNVVSSNVCSNDGYCSIALGGSSRCLIIDNDCSNGTGGIWLNTDDCTVSDNDCSNNYGFGISVQSSSHLSIFRNDVRNNLEGITIDSESSNNRIWNNSFLWNTYPAEDDGTDNLWNTSGSPHGYGNYWSNLTGPDVNADGIVDDPFDFAMTGSAGAKDYYPRIAMSCTITSPTSASALFTNWNQIKLTGVAYDDIKVTSVTWSNSLGGSGTAYMTPQWGGASVSWQSRGNIQLFAGVNVITVTAHDAAGNTVVDILNVTYEKVLPVVTITAPTSSPSYSTNSATIALAGTASDASGIATVTWKNMATGTSGTATGTGNWSITDIPLNIGTNLIYVNATDNAGNRGSDAIWVTYRVDTLVVTITAPTSSPTMTTSWHQIKLMGTAFDDIKVTTVTWSNSLTGDSGVTYMVPQFGGASVNWQSRGQIHLINGDNVITVTAYDSSGNSRTDVLTVTYTGL